MKDANVVHQLIRGFRNVDQMRLDVKELLCSLMGLIRQGELLHSRMRDEYSEIFISEDGKYQWKLGAIIYYGDRESKITLECFVRSFEQGESRHSCVQLFDKNNIWFAGGAESALESYAALPTLVNGLLAKFPFMRERCKPFFQAAEVDLS